MTSASECVREQLERVAAGVGVHARLQLEEDAEGVSAKYVREDLGLVIGHHGG
jgi:predicted RNA-binding protein Jag